MSNTHPTVSLDVEDMTAAFSDPLRYIVAVAFVIQSTIRVYTTVVPPPARSALSLTCGAVWCTEPAVTHGSRQVIEYTVRRPRDPPRKYKEGGKRVRALMGLTVGEGNLKNQAGRVL